MAIETDYGEDFSNAGDFDANMSSVTGPLGVVEAIVRRFETPRGGLWYSSYYGTDLRQYLNGHATEFEVTRAVEIEALKDERVESAKASVTIETTKMIVQLELELADGPFLLTIDVTELTVELVNFRQAA